MDVEDNTKIQADRTRDLARQHLARAKISQADMARQAGIASTTFSAWLNDKYAGNNEAVTVEVEKYLTAQATRGRMALVAALPFVMTPTATRILTTLEHAQFLPDVVVIAGEPGTGKTRSIKEYAATHPNVLHLTGQPATKTAFQVLDALGNALNVTETTVQRITRGVIAKLKNTQGLLIYDEAQNLSPEAIDQLRSFHDLAGVGLVLAGHPAVWAKIDGGSRGSKLANLHSRVGMNVNIPRLQKEDLEAVLDGIGIADAQQRKLLKRIASLPGALRALDKVVRMARMLADGEDAEMAAEHIMAAWHRFSNGQELGA
jgi:DNA transposition AAA+ family ATPase